MGRPKVDRRGYDEAGELSSPAVVVAGPRLGGGRPGRFGRSARGFLGEVLLLDERPATLAVVEGRIRLVERDPLLARVAVRIAEQRAENRLEGRAAEHIGADGLAQCRDVG